MQEKVRQMMMSIVSVHKEMIKLISEKMKDSELSPDQFFLLTRIYKNQDNNQKKLATDFHISEATLSVRINRLVKGGYINKTVNPNDKRNYCLTVSDRGKELLKNNYEILNDVVNISFEGISDEDFEYVYSLIEKVKSNIERGEKNA